jgi:hypothetical protein
VNLEMNGRDLRQLSLHMFAGNEADDDADDQVAAGL